MRVLKVKFKEIYTWYDEGSEEKIKALEKQAVRKELISSVMGGNASIMGITTNMEVCYCRKINILIS